MPARELPTAITDRIISTPRLRLRPWTEDDAPAALAVFGAESVSRWLAPAMEQVPDEAAMRSLLSQWSGDHPAPGRPAGRWAVEVLETSALIGGAAVLPLPPAGEDLEISWQLAPGAWGQGFATEAGQALARFAFSAGEEELFAVVRPRNTHGKATAERVGMEWVGETDKYYDLHLQVYRLRKGDLNPVAGQSASGIV